MLNRGHVYVGPHVQRRRHHPRRRRPAPPQAGRLLHGRRQHADASPAGGRRPAAAGQRRQHRRDAVVRRPARLLREHARRQHHQQEEVPLGAEHPRHLEAGRDARDRLPRDARASASTACGGPAAATPTWPSHFDGYTDHILAIVDLQNITKPEIVSKWWLPGMHRAGGEPSTLAPGQARRAPPHDRGRQLRLRRLARRRLHDSRRERSGAAEAAVAHQLVAAVSGRHAHAAAAARAASSRVVADEANAERCAKGTFHTFVVDVRAPENPVPIATLPTPTGRDFCGLGTFGPHNLYENRPERAAERDDDFRHLQQRRRARVRSRQPVRAARDGVVDAAAAGQADRSAAERGAARPRARTCSSRATA